MEPMPDMPDMPAPEPCMSSAIRTDHHQPTLAIARRAVGIPYRRASPPAPVELRLSTAASLTPAHLSGGPVSDASGWPGAFGHAYAPEGNPSRQLGHQLTVERQL